MKLLDFIESRKKAYTKTWDSLSKSNKVLVAGLILIGILQIFLGLYLCSLGK